MGRRESITVYGETFKTKKALADRCREILYRYKPGELLNEADSGFIVDLLRRHPNAEEKFGDGILSIAVQETEYGNQGFWLNRVDGSGTDFSFLHCITPRSPLDDFKKACRNEVHEQIQEFKCAAFHGEACLLCPVVGEILTIGTCHVDHEAPATFEALVQAFVAAVQIDPLKVEILGYEDGEVEKRFADRDLAARWNSYHQENAKLRIVSKRANLSTLRRRDAGEGA